MYLPQLPVRKQRYQKQTVSFRGLNYGTGVTDGQLEDSRNLSSEQYPCMTPRRGRANEWDYSNATAVYYKDGLMVVDGTDLIFDGEIVGAVSPGTKHFAYANTKIVIMPDMLVFDTSTKELRGLSAEYTTAAGSATFTDRELTALVGSFAEKVSGSGNVGGNTTLGQNGPTFMLSQPPFDAIYSSVKVNESTGVFELGDSLTGDAALAQNVNVGAAFKATGLGADGVKLYGRITGKTEFAGGAAYVWDTYLAKYTLVSETEKTAYLYGQEDDPRMNENLPLDETSTTTNDATVSLFYGFVPIMDGNGNITGIYDKKGFYRDISATPGTYELTGLPNGAFVAAYKFNRYGDKSYTICSDVYSSDGLSVKTTSHVSHYTKPNGVEEYIYMLHFSLYGYKATSATVAKGQALGNAVIGSEESAYPTDGAKLDIWYTYNGYYEATNYYGFDYNLIEIAEVEGKMGFEAVNFRAGDTVEISGCTTLEDNNITATVREIRDTDDGGETKSVLVFDANTFQAGTEAGAVTIRRKAPKLSVICESDNRIWGAEGNTIYASALGDPTNFYTYDGVDTDSYAVAVSSDGKFTGGCGYGKSVLFFKEDRMIKILGDYPSQYTLYEYQVPGVKSGSELSLCNVNETIYYHGREGIYRYSGGSPELISDVFGMHRYENAAAGAAGDRYYISMHERGTGGEWGLWVYDISRGLWVQEDGTEARCFTKNGEKLLYIDGGAQKLVCVNPEESDELIQWSGTLCRMDETVHNRKCYSKLYLRGELLTDEAWLQAEISCDGEPFRKVYTSRDKRTKTLVIPILPTRCDSFRVRLSGEGPFIIRSLVREYSTGSEY